MNTFQSSWFRRIAANGLLLIVLLGILAAYTFVVIDLPAKLYSSDQRAFLSENAARIINQLAPTWNVFVDGGMDPYAFFPVKDSRVTALLKARVEAKDGINITVYDLDFHGEYLLEQSGPSQAAKVELFFPFPANLKTLYDVSFLVDGKETAEAQYAPDGIRWQAELAAGEERTITIAYRAAGANSFGYSLARNHRANVSVQVAVEGLAGSQVHEFSLPATQVKRLGGQEVFIWEYNGLIATRDINLQLAEQPGFLQRAAQMQRTFRSLAWLAPLLVAGFVLALGGLFWLSNLRLPLEHYLMAGCGVALFYPLLTFFSGIMQISLAALLAFILVGSLILVFLRISTNDNRVWWRAGLMLGLFPGIFSLGMLTSYKGLFISAGSFVLAAVMMLLFVLRPKPLRSPDEDAAGETIQSTLEPDGETVARPVDAEPGSEDEPGSGLTAEQRTARCCPGCGAHLETQFHFCPSCGYDMRVVRRCAACGCEQIPPIGLEKPFCLCCGVSI